MSDRQVAAEGARVRQRGNHALCWCGFSGIGLEINANAEGVEHEAQASILREPGCHEMQGYLSGKLLPLSESRGMLERASEEHRQTKRLHAAG